MIESKPHCPNLLEPNAYNLPSSVNIIECLYPHAAFITFLLFQISYGFYIYGNVVNYL